MLLSWMSAKPKGESMIIPWYPTAMLAFESSQVIGLRLRKMACGSVDARAETQLMVQEKMDACIEASGTLMGGGTMYSVVDRYRQHVSANSARLLAA